MRGGTGFENCVWSNSPHWNENDTSYEVEWSKGVEDNGIFDGNDKKLKWYLTNQGFRMVNDILPIVFGPVPSRRLGRSLGVNNIPPKVCSYSCIYCQLGRTIEMDTIRKKFFRPEVILEEVEGKVYSAKAIGETIDYITFVSDGEPTLDIDIGREIESMKGLGLKIAVITNSSLIWQKDVQKDLSKADWVSLKIDAVSESIWHKVNRPHGALELDRILNGIRDFSSIFHGKLTTETMMVHGINDDVGEMERIAAFIEGLSPFVSYIAIPTRPPAEAWAGSPTEEAMNLAFQTFRDRSIDVEYLIGYEGNEFTFTGKIEDDLLSIMSVHPMRKEGVDELLKKANAHWNIIDKLLNEKKITEVTYKDRKFYMRRFLDRMED